MLPKEIILASDNLGKLKEFRELFTGTHTIKITSQKYLNLKTPKETGKNLTENALLKAYYVAQKTNLSVLADDSGLEVDALSGAPGIYSSRYAHVNATDEDNRMKLLQALDNIAKEKRSARYRCVLVYIDKQAFDQPIICEGFWEGLIHDTPQGQFGFGYDPIFYLPEMDCTAAELTSKVKNKLSHRALAIKKLYKKILSQC